VFKNYIKFAIRNLMRQKLYSAINISGLAIGVAIFIMISLWLLGELSYDQFHIKKDRIFRVNSITEDYGIVTSSSWRLGTELKAAYPEIEDYTRFWPWSTSLVRFGDNVFNKLNLGLADPSAFRIFSFKFIQGDPESALAGKHSIVITTETANRCFGDANPLGKSIYVREYDTDFQVGGVIDNLPENSTIQFDILARIDLMPKERLESWEFSGYTYILLKENTKAELVNLKIKDFYRKYVSTEAKASPVLQKFTNIHLYEMGKPGLIKLVYFFAIIAALILLISCINYMNLNTARSVKRAKEIGVRKMIGANRMQLISQFLIESILISSIAFVFAILIVEMTLPVFNSFIGKNLMLFSAGTLKGLIFVCMITLISGIISGSYPAFYLSSFKPNRILKVNYAAPGRGKPLRRFLSVFQFTIAIGLIISTLVIRAQMSLVENFDLGIDRKLVLDLPNNQDLNNQFDSYKNELIKSSGVINVTASAANPLDVGQSIRINWEGHYDQDELPLPYTMVDYDFFKTFEMQLIEGRDFSKEFPSDEKEACILNEAAVDAMGVASPIGMEVYFDHPGFEESDKKVKVIGVVKNFHHASLHKKIQPFIFRMHRPWNNHIFVKIAENNIPETLNRIEKITRKFAPEYPFQFMFLEDTYRNIYTREFTTGKLFSVFTILAILISCMGLYGLAAFSAEQRTKEIGIRKVLGASLLKLIYMLTKESAQWVIIANLLAWPVAWYIMSQWLENFAYKTIIHWWVFILAGFISMLITIGTVSWQAVRTALANPVESLRYE
jgi:putative ABC transport system permease protein